MASDHQAMAPVRPNRDQGTTRRDSRGATAQGIQLDAFERSGVSDETLPLPDAIACLCVARGQAGMPALRFRVPGQPVAKGRPKVSIRGGRFAHVYTPAKTLDFENRVRFAAKEAMERAGFERPIDGPLRVVLSILVGMPAGWSGKRRQEALDGQIASTRKPDVDNVAKAVIDGMNAIVYPDDARVVELIARKAFDLEPGVDVEVCTLAARPAP